jgi:type VI protein secretion system component VasK
MRNFVSIILALLSLVFIVVLTAFALNMGITLVSSFIGIFLGIILVSFVLFFVLFAGAVFWLWMFIDCLKREDFGTQKDKIVWTVVLLLTSMIGAVVYFFVVKKKMDARQLKRRRKKK